MPSGTLTDEFKSPVKKLVACFRKSRDQWKAKHRLLKKQLKKKQNQVYAVECSREMWRTRAEQLNVGNQQLQTELDELKKTFPAA